MTTLESIDYVCMLREQIWSIQGDMGDTLRTKIRLCQYDEISLDETLGKLSEQRVDVLERILESHLTRLPPKQ